MKYAIFTSTINGRLLALKARSALQNMLPQLQVDVFVHQKSLGDETEAVENNIQSYSRLALLMEDAFKSYEALIFIMASGIVVRSIAPYIVSKTSDPAVLVMDEKGKHVITLLSGHLGGANQLASMLAPELGGEAVLTTATDVNGLCAPDAFAQLVHCQPVKPGKLLFFNSSLLAGWSITYLMDKALDCIEKYETVLEAKGLQYKVVDADTLALYLDNLAAGFKAGAGSAVEKSLYVIVSENELKQHQRFLYLKPERLVAGIGCRKGVPKELVLQALSEACHTIGWTEKRIDHLASTLVKQDEQGLIEAAETLQLPITFFDNEAMQEKIYGYNLQESAFVKKTIGVGNVCEAAALCWAGDGVIALPKTKYEKVTVALIWQK